MRPPGTAEAAAVRRGPSRWPEGRMVPLLADYRLLQHPISLLKFLKIIHDHYFTDQLYPERM